MYTRNKNKLNVVKNGGKQLFLSPYGIMTLSQCFSFVHFTGLNADHNNVTVRDTQSKIHKNIRWSLVGNNLKRKHATVSVIESNWQHDIYILNTFPNT